MRRQEWIDSIAVFALTLVCTTYAFPRWADWNQNSRFDLTVAIVDHGSLSIDCCVDNTGDYAEIRGRTYSDKAPGLSFLAVPPYLLWRTLTAAASITTAVGRAAHGDAFQGTLRVGGTGLRPDKVAFASGLAVATVMAVAIPSAFLTTLLFHFLGTFSRRRGHRIAVALCYALGTIAFPYAGAFYAHQLVAALLFAAFVILFGLPDARHRGFRLAIVGLLLGYAVICEYPTAVAAAILLTYAAYQLSRCQPRAAALLQLRWTLGALLIPLTALAGYHWAVVGTPWGLPYHYSALYLDRHSIGFISISWPRLDALWGLTFSPYRGVFFLSPVLLLSLPGWWYLWRVQAWRPVACVSLALVASFFLFNSASAMWWGGFTVGPRYLAPAMPFLAWPMVLFLEHHGHAPAGRAAFTGLAIVSILSVWGLTWAGQSFPEDSWRFPWRDYAWPQLRQGNLARNVGMLFGLSGWVSLLPLAVMLSGLLVMWRALVRR